MSARLYLAVAAGGLLLSACATNYNETASNNAVDVEAQEAAPNVERRTSINFQDAVKDEDRIICKRTIRTGTRFPTRECRSWREWREMMEVTRDILREGEMRNLQTDVPGGG